jgi:VanZ family protein
VLATYWLLAFVVTHLPPLLPKEDEPGPEPLIGFDKIVHFVGFAILAWLLMNWLTRRHRFWRAAGATLVTCAVYGVVDEVTQPIFARTADPMDWVADMIGTVVGIGLSRVNFSNRNADPEPTPATTRV